MKQEVNYLNIQGFQKTTLLDYPKHVASTIFFGGCNFRCPFCHNGDLVLSCNSNIFSQKEILAYLEKRKRILDGVCITGGEPTLQQGLASFLEKIKELGLSIKLDTNGYRPQILKELCNFGLIDYIAMDIKGTPEKYANICGLQHMDFSKIEESVDFLKNGNIDYEFRTTVTKEFHTKEDFETIGSWLSGVKAYYLQGYQDSPQVIAHIIPSITDNKNIGAADFLPVLSHSFTAYTFQELCEFQLLLKNYISVVEIRGVENTENEVCLHRFKK